MNEQALRQMYAMAMIEVAGAAPGSVFDTPLNPVMIKFAESLVRRCATIAEDHDVYQTYNLQGEILGEFGLTS